MRTTSLSVLVIVVYCCLLSSCILLSLEFTDCISDCGLCRLPSVSN